jgi:hypothetical protein
VLPVLVTMLGLAMLRKSGLAVRRRLMHVLLAGGVALVVFSPWLIRNAAQVGNPVFPLATSWLGKGHWTDQQQQRWIAGHSPASHPPVPAPPDYEPRPPTDRLTLLFRTFFANDLWGHITMLLFLVSAGELASRGRRRDPWDWSLLAVAAGLLAVWGFATSEMPGRFATPVAVPMVLLAAGFLSRLARVETNPLRRNAGPTQSGLPWGLAPAAVLLVMAMFVNLATVSLGDGVFSGALRVATSPPGTPGAEHAVATSLTWELQRNGSDVAFPADAAYGKFLLVGGTPFFHADGSLYATPFDTPPLLALAGEGTPAERLERLRQAGVQFIGVEWRDLRRLAYSYGLPAELFAEMHRRQATGQPPALRQIEDLKVLGVVELQSFFSPPPRQFQLPTADGKFITWPDYTLYAMPWASITTWPVKNDDAETRGRGDAETDAL